MQQISSKDSVPFNEEYMLGEQHNMGELKAAYYVSYTNEDMHRYTINAIVLVFAILIVCSGLLFLGFDIFGWAGIHNTWPHFYPFSLLLNSLVIYYSFTTQRKWSNRPLVGHKTRHLRVYAYQEGLIKQTDKRSDVVRWSEIAEVVYIPYIAPQSNARWQQIKIAGIKLKLRSRRTLKISGAIVHIDELAGLLNYKLNNYAPVTI